MNALSAIRTERLVTQVEIQITLIAHLAIMLEFSRLSLRQIRYTFVVITVQHYSVLQIHYQVVLNRIHHLHYLNRR
jgi:hypothetical protein